MSASYVFFHGRQFQRFVLVSWSSHFSGRWAMIYWSLSQSCKLWSPIQKTQTLVNEEVGGRAFLFFSWLSSVSWAIPKYTVFVDDWVMWSLNWVCFVGVYHYIYYRVFILCHCKEILLNLTPFQDSGLRYVLQCHRIRPWRWYFWTRCSLTDSALVRTNWYLTWSRHSRLS